MITSLNLRSFRGLARPTLLPLALSAAVLLAVSACSGGKVPSAPPAVVVAVPMHPDTATAAGTAMRYPIEIESRYSNPMSFRVAGKLVERKVRSGDTVKKGETVARLDPVDAQKQAASAQAALEAAEHRLVFAQQQLDRDSAQAAQNLIAANQLEQTQDGFSAAQAAQVQAAAQRVIARNNLEYHTLIADHDGVITSESADTGQVVTAGQAVYGLAWSGAVDATLDAAASDAGRIVIGQAASVSFPGLPGRSFSARVREISPAADPQSRTYRVKLTLAQPDQAVRLGMTGDATLSPLAATAGGAPAEATFTVPATAIFHQGNSPAVFVVAANTSSLTLRPVTVRSYGGRFAVVAKGLKDGDTVVVAGVHSVFAGERVTVVRPLFDGEGDLAGVAPAQGDVAPGSVGAGQ